MPTRAGLLDAHAVLTAAIRASEAWEKSYTDSPATFKRLLREEAKLQASVLDYLSGLSERAPRLVNWSEVQLRPMTASQVPPADDKAWTEEQARLLAAIYPSLIELMVVGANAGEDIYGVPLSITTLDEAIIKGADRYTAGLVKDVTDTTRRKIQLAIKQAIKQGENATATIERIRKLVASPVRAEMIAQTESVNAYQSGLDIFGEASGVKSWTWDALLGACKLCAPLDGVTKVVGKPFVLGNGKEVMRPAAHTRCRCGRIANY
jgi:hypothetical protein